MEWKQEEYLITDDSSKIEIEKVYKLLNNTYWGVRRPLDVVTKMIEHSLCFSIFHNSKLIGFGRVVTDYTVFSWVADIVIEPEYRKQGLGKWFMSCIKEHPLLRTTQMVLQTRDAHEYYKKYGFTKNEALMSTAVDGL